jgi:hypothetical protein
MDAVLLTITACSRAAAAGFGGLGWRVGMDARARSRARIAALGAEMDPPSAAVRIAVGSIVERAAGLGRPLVAFAAIGVMIVAIGIAAVIATRGAAPAPAAASTPSPLELMSMRYQHAGTTLTVSGLVRNPAGAASVTGISAVVFAFDRTGAFVASGRAPLDFSALSPGDESPFVVTVPNVADVARYRVSFRTGTGVVRHVDRRATSALAQAVR